MQEYAVPYMQTICLCMQTRNVCLKFDCCCVSLHVCLRPHHRPLWIDDDDDDDDDDADDDDNNNNNNTYIYDDTNTNTKNIRFVHPAPAGASRLLKRTPQGPRPG